jgi:hypothetical protein
MVDDSEDSMGCLPWVLIHGSIIALGITGGTLLLEMLNNKMYREDLIRTTITAIDQDANGNISPPEGMEFYRSIGRQARESDYAGANLSLIPNTVLENYLKSKEAELPQRGDSLLEKIF